MTRKDLLRQFGRRVRLGMVGGGADSVIGLTHLLAMRVDGFCELVVRIMKVPVAESFNCAAIFDLSLLFRCTRVTSTVTTSLTQNAPYALSTSQSFQGALRSSIGFWISTPLVPASSNIESRSL